MDKNTERYPVIRVRITPHEAKIFKELKDLYGLSARRVLELSGSCDCKEPVVDTYKKKQVVIPRNILSKKRS